MFKKITSMATAVVIMAGGLAVATAPGSFATSSDATLDLSATQIKGVTVPSHTPTTCIDCMGSPTTVQTTITLTPAQAASTSATSIFVPTDPSAVVKVLKFAYVSLPFTDTSMTNGVAWDLTSAVYHNEIIIIRVTATDGVTKKYYGYKISAASSDATLMRAKFKGATSVLGTPNANIANVVAGSVTVTADSATATNIFPIISGTVMGFTPPQVKKFASGSSPSANDFQSAANYSTGVLTDGDIIVIKNTAEDNTTSLFYKIVVTIGAAQQQQNSNSSSSSSDAAAIAAAAAQRAAAVVAAKSTIVDTLKAGKPVTASDLSAADIAIASAKAADRVNAKLLALPAEKRADLATLQTLVRTENFVDKVSTPATQIRVTSRDLVIEQLIPADYKHKASVIRAILAQNAASLDSIEKVEAVVKAAVSAIQARKDRIAAIIAKINGTK